MSNSKVGIWLIGARGSIATTVMVGATAIRQGLMEAGGMVTATEAFVDLPLTAIADLEFGGCDIRPRTLLESARQLQEESGCFGQGIIDRTVDALCEIDGRISMGTTINCGATIEDLASGSCRNDRTLLEDIEKIRQHIQQFKVDRGLDMVVVVNLASTEPLLELAECHQRLALFLNVIDRNEKALVRASTLYAYAAIREGCPYINFTPSNAALIPALVTLAQDSGVPVMGNDGKTGETLVKSALAPMFASRNLEILSWEGFNILGNLDGKVLNDPDNCASKLKVKDQVLEKILGYAPHSKVHINYVPSLADQKTAWDFIHFKGFCGAKMTLQFTWQGYDSLLAAPLVLDLARLAVLAKGRGESGLMPQLASFFKAPLGVAEYRHAAQFEMLGKYVDKIRSSPNESDRAVG